LNQEIKIKEQEIYHLSKKYDLVKNPEREDNIHDKIKKSEEESNRLAKEIKMLKNIINLQGGRLIKNNISKDGTETLENQVYSNIDKKYRKIFTI